MKEQFISKRFSSQSLDKVIQAEVIINEYERQGFQLTLRQLYYQFVSRGYIKNTPREYARLGSVINDARLCGLIDWDAISDRSRYLRSRTHWDSPRQIIESAIHGYYVNKWQDSDQYVEVWVEKEALIDIVEQITRLWDCPCFACKGYVSQTAMYEAAQRFASYGGVCDCTLFYLGDHDPSGLDMTRDIQERLNTFGGGVEVERLALNMDQIREHNPPPNPAKTTDSRFKGYILEHGRESWEVDALEPKILSQLIENAILSKLDKEVWNQNVQREEREKAKMIGLLKYLEE